MSKQNISAESTSEGSKEQKCKLDEFIKNGFKTFVEATKAANDLPKGRDFDFYSTHESFSNALSNESNKILTLINRVLKANSVDGNIKSSVLNAKEELIGEANDVILDRAVTAIDELNGLRSLPSNPVMQVVSAEISVNGSWNKVNSLSVNSYGNNAVGQQSKNIQKSIKLLTAKNVVRPQAYFQDKIDNGNANPWKPRITEKPNSLKPLALYLEPSAESEDFEEYSHPYEFELDHFKVPDEFVANIETPMVVKPTTETPLYEISTEEELINLVEELRKHKEIAVDLEHHSYRTFLGITCLMQISTREADYIIDTLTLRNKLHILNEVFTKPSIIKIFHGADSDVLWLQRDLSLYLVNLFDTHKAATVLGYSSVSLAYLLNRFCSFMPNKKFQLADWRIRPLPQELKDYAREDTHYLIYVYEVLKQELYKAANGNDNLIRSVFHQSTEVCKSKYIKPRWTPDSHMNLYRRRKKMFDNRQMYALRELYKWRDALARDEDESVGYVLPNHMMLQIAEMLPREIQGILACCNPIPPLVRANSLELHHIILKAREQPLERVMHEENRKIVKKELVKINVDSPLHCPHDLTKQDFNSNLPTLLMNTRNKILDQNSSILSLEKTASSLTAFNDPVDKKNNAKKMKHFEFLGPYERYKLIKPFLQAEAEKEKEEAKKKNESNEKDPSVQDRIAALHEHFVHVQQTVAQSAADAPISLDQPLINMPGSKKRKREQSAERETQDPQNLREEILFESNHNKKQKIHESFNSESPDAKTEKKKNQGKKKQGSKNQKNADSNKHKKSSFNRGRGKQYKGNYQSREEESYDHRQESYDYSQVDYSQFSGGGKSVHHKQIEHKYKSKGQGKRGGRGSNQNRSMTFHTRGFRGGRGSRFQGGSRGNY